MKIDIIPGSELESDLTLIGQGTVIQGKAVFDRFTRIQGKIEGNVVGLAGSFIVLGEMGTIHGNIECDEIIIDGLVYGNIKAKHKVTISETGKLMGDVTVPKFEIKFGAYFEGKAITSPAPNTNQPSA